MIEMKSYVSVWAEENYSTCCKIKVSEDADIGDVLKAALKLMAVEGFDKSTLNDYEQLIEYFSLTQGMSKVDREDGIEAMHDFLEERGLLYNE